MYVKRHFKYIIAGVIFWLLCLGAGASPYAVTADTLASPADGTWQEYQLRIPDEDFLRPFREDPAFRYNREYTLTWWDKLRLWLLKNLFRHSSDTGMLWQDSIIKIFAALLIIFLIYKLVRAKYAFPFGRKVYQFGAEETGLDETLDAVSYPEMVKQAVAAGNYILAVRIHYLYLLQLMDKKGIIRWDAHKTNHAYVYEIKEEQLREEFSRLSHVFNCVCYGEFQVDDFLYRRLESEFHHFQKEVEA